eukprot:9860639-Lingulodinium_polyedra.AAC.1
MATGPSSGCRCPSSSPSSSEGSSASSSSFARGLAMRIFRTCLTSVLAALAGPIVVLPSREWK